MVGQRLPTVRAVHRRGGFGGYRVMSVRDCRIITALADLPRAAS